MENHYRKTSDNNRLDLTKIHTKNKYAESSSRRSTCGNMPTNWGMRWKTPHGKRRRAAKTGPQPGDTIHGPSERSGSGCSMNSNE